MSDPIIIDLFVEDQAHEDLLRPMVRRLGAEEGRSVRIRVRSARGGRGRALTEFEVYQKSMLNGLSDAVPHIIVAAIDANCASYQATRQDIADTCDPRFVELCVAACPDPHIERWYLADLPTFHRVVGTTPTFPREKCERDFYKHVLAQAVIDGGNPPTLGGLEFAEELAQNMDLHRAGRSETSLGHFVTDLRGKLRLLSSDKS